MLANGNRVKEEEHLAAEDTGGEIKCPSLQGKELMQRFDYITEKGCVVCPWL